MLDKLERKLGRLAIPNLMNYIIGGYILGYIFMFTIPDILAFMTLEPHLIIHKFQFWRVITWVLIPPSSPGFFTIIMLFFYWQLGRSLEAMWGTFKFNVYILGGIFITVLGAFIYYAIVYVTNGIFLSSMGMYFSTYYINMSIFLAFALTIPDMHILLYFFIPIKMKWLGILYGVLVFSSFLNAQVLTERVAIACSLLNFVIFFLATKRFRGINRGGAGRGGFSRGAFFRGGQNNRQNYNRSNTRNGYNPFGGGAQARQNYNNASGNRNSAVNNNVKTGPISRHKCAVCGRTEITNPELEFRFCSKCNGNYEYCNEHLFTHNHVQ